MLIYTVDNNEHVSMTYLGQFIHWKGDMVYLFFEKK